jgi:hypothetical protein
MEGRKDAGAGDTAVTEAQAVGGAPGEQVWRVLTLISVLERAAGASDRQAAADLGGRRDPTRRVMASSGLCQTALGSARLPHGRGRRHGVCGPIAGADRQAWPQRLLSGRTHLLRQGDGWVEPCCTGLPGHCGTRRGQRGPGWALPLWPPATPTSQGAARAECGRHAFVPSTGDQSHADNDTLCQRELAAAGEVLGALLGDRLHEAADKCAQWLRKIDRGRRLFGSCGLSWFHGQSMNAFMLYALIRLCLKSTALGPAALVRRCAPG